MSLDAAVSPAVRTRYLCDFSIDFDEIQTIPTGTGLRLNYVVREGVVTGDRLSGTFIAGGGDWITIGTDQIGHLDVRATVRTDDGELIYITNTGRVDLRGGIAERLGAGEALTSKDLYARSAPLFETGSEKYAWMNSIVTVALNGLAPQHVDYSIFEIL